MNFRVLILLFITLVSCKESSLIVLDIEGKSLEVELAYTNEQRQKGLMYRDELGENSGMLFVFEKEQKLSFWMKNTKIPLSIAYIDKSGKILEIYDMKPYSLESVPSKRSSIMYALEVNRGYFNRNDITVGSYIDLSSVKDYLKSSK